MGPERRAYHSSFISKGKLYIYGGHDINDRTYNSMWTLDLEKVRRFKTRFENRGQGVISFNNNNASYFGISYETDLKFGWEKINSMSKPI